jgi:hypothetical protein
MLQRLADRVVLGVFALLFQIAVTLLKRLRRT